MVVPTSPVGAQIQCLGIPLLGNNIFRAGVRVPEMDPQEQQQHCMRTSLLMNLVRPPIHGSVCTTLSLPWHLD